MAFDNALAAAKLRRWEKYLRDFRLPSWEEIPDIGLYMEQVTELLRQYLDYLPPELKEEQFITAATINNYVRTKTMPEPRKKRYYREHIAYLIVILTLKQSLSMALIKRVIPADLPKEKVREFYTAYAARHCIAAQNFTEQVAMAAAPILSHEPVGTVSTGRTEELIVMSAITGGFCRLLAEKLLLLDGVSLADVPEEELTART